MTGPDDCDASDDEKKYALMQLDGAQSGDEFYASVALLIRRAHELTAEELETLAEASSYPWVRAEAKRPVKHDRRDWVFFNCLCWLTANRGEDGKKRLPQKAVAIDMITAKFPGVSRDAARKLYEEVASVGPEYISQRRPFVRKRRDALRRKLPLA